MTSASQVHTNRSHHDGCVPEGGPGGAAAAPAVVYEKSTLSRQGEQGSSMSQPCMLEPPRNGQWINDECFPHADIMYLSGDAGIYTKLKHSNKESIVRSEPDLSQLYLTSPSRLDPVTKSLSEGTFSCPPHSYGFHLAE